MEYMYSTNKEKNFGQLKLETETCDEKQYFLISP